MCVKVVDQKPG